MITVEKIRQIVRLKQMTKRWKRRSSRFDSGDCCSDSDSSRHRVPPGFFAVYVGDEPERRRFVIPTRFLKIPIFVSLLKKAEEEFGFQINGGLVLPCEVGFFERLLKELEKDEERLKETDLEEVLRRFSEVGLDSCKDGTGSCQVFTPLLQNTRV